MENTDFVGLNTQFDWDFNDFDSLLANCKTDEAVQITLKYLHKDHAFLEAGCGSGRVVKYFTDLGYRNVVGVEINEDAVRYLNLRFPELNIISGDLLRLPKSVGLFDVIGAYGVVEHFEGGIQKPLLALRSLLRENGIMIVSVPSFNLVRRLKKFLAAINPRTNSLIRSVFGKNTLHHNSDGTGFDIYPSHGKFFEYRLSRQQFEEECKKADLEIVESVPIYHMDGFFHELNFGQVKYASYTFEPTRLAFALNGALKIFPFFHNHMHLCVLRKPVR